LNCFRLAERNIPFQLTMAGLDPATQSARVCGVIKIAKATPDAFDSPR
jgi:hypothetical protein